MQTGIAMGERTVREVMISPVCQSKGVIQLGI
jgi:hypothetical protein